ncbi:MAG: PorP/SprF family type IX secretion system membrane protein [Bacteroidota bacterium]
MKKLLICLFLLIGYGLSAQQYPETQLYAINPYMINPGFNGYYSDLSAYASVMSPITMEDGAIRNYQVGVNKSLEKEYVGIGGRLRYDQRDFFESIYVDASFAYRLVTDNKHVLSVGSDIGLVNRTYNIGELSPYVDLRDPTLYSDYYYQTNFNLGFGLAYYSSEIEAGIALPHLVEGSEPFNGYFNAYFAYKVYFYHDEWQLKPNVFFVNYPDGTTQLEGNVMITRKGMFWGQLGATSNRAVTIATGWKFDSYELVYSHRQELNSQLPYLSRGEIMLRVHMGRSGYVLSNVRTKRNRK